MTSIGRRCRDGDVHSRAILITRTLSEACPDNGAGRKKKLIREPYVRHPPPWMRKEIRFMPEIQLRRFESHVKTSERVEDESRFQLTIFR